VLKAILAVVKSTALGIGVPDGQSCTVYKAVAKFFNSVIRIFK
jgi:hypothetical protein